MVVRAMGARVLSDLRANLDLPRSKAAHELTDGFRGEQRDPDQRRDLRSARIAPATSCRSDPRRSAEICCNERVQTPRRSSATTSRKFSRAPLITPPSSVLPEHAGATARASSTRRVLTLVGTAAAPTYDVLVDITTAPANLNALMGSLGWAANCAVRGALLKLKDPMARPYGLDIPRPRAILSTLRTLCGVAGTTNPHPIVFGNWNDLILDFWSEIDLLSEPIWRRRFPARVTCNYAEQ